MAKKQKRERPDAHGARAVARMNRAAGQIARSSPVLIPIAVHHDPVAGPVVVVPEDVPVKRVPRRSWMDFLLGRGKR